MRDLNKAERACFTMTDSEHEQWEAYYEEAAQRDFERAIYRRCDEEDSEERP